MARLPVPGSDEDAWGDVLNDFLRVAHHDDGQLRGVINTVNIRDFGAVGDGETDDTLAIQRALDFAPDRGSVVVPNPPEFYKISHSLEIKKSLAFVGIGILPTITSSNFDQPVLTVNAPHNSIVVVDNFGLIGGTIGLDITGGGLTRQSRFRNLLIHGCADAAIDIRTGMIGAQFENIHIINSPEYGIRCLNTSRIISVRFVTCRIAQTRKAAVLFEHRLRSSVHGISFVSPIIESNKGSGIVLRGGFSLSIYDAHFESNGLETGGPDLDLSSNEHLRVICDVQLFKGVFSAPSPAQRNNDLERILFSSHHVSLVMYGTFLSHKINANFNTAATRVAFINMLKYPEVKNYPSPSYITLQGGYLQLGRGVSTSGLSLASLEGIPEDENRSYNLRGSITVAGTDESAVVPLLGQDDNAYYLNVTPTSLAGTPLTGSNRIKQISKAATEFTIHLENAPGDGNSVTFDWFLVR